MRESIKRLRQICQTPRKNCDTWHGRNIARPLSIYITVLFLKLGITANLATAIFLFTGIAASFTLASADRAMILAGALLFQVWYILDHVDGEIARYRKQSSLTGEYFDRLSHYIVNPLFFLCLGFGIFLRTQRLNDLAAGIAAGLSIILIGVVNDIYDSVSESSSKKREGNLTPGRKISSLPRKIFSFFYYICTFPVIIDIFLLFAIAEVLFKNNIILFFLWFYSICLFFMWSMKAGYIILARKLDK